MGEPARKLDDETPNLHSIKGGGNTTPDRANLHTVPKIQPIPITSLKQRESAPENINKDESISDQESSGQNIWRNSVEGKVGFNKNSKFSLKKKGAMGFIIAVIIGCTGFGVVSYPYLLTQSLYSNILDKFNSSQETSATIRSRLLIKDKTITTDGCTTFTKLMCKYTRPSNRTLKLLSENNIKALDSDGNIIESSDDLFPNKRPVKYQFTTESGETMEVAAKDFYKTINSTSDVKSIEFAKAFSSSIKPRWLTLTDSVFQSIKEKLGFSINNPLNSDSEDTTSSKSSDTTQKTGASVAEDELSDISSIDSEVSDSTTEGLENSAKTIITEEATDEASKLDGSSKGGIVSIAAGGVCLLADVPTIITRAAQSYQVVQVARYATPIMSFLSSVRAGDAKATPTTQVLGLITTSVNGKSAMDSFGVNYVINGDTTSNSSSYKKFIPGYSIIKTLSGVTSITNSATRKAACAVATSDETGYAIDIAETAASGGTAVLINLAADVAATTVLNQVLPGAISSALSILPINDIMSGFMGDLTANLTGEDVGNAFVSGMSQVMSQTANAGGNAPLTVSQAIAYNKVTSDIQVAEANQDRATKSPLDISSQYTLAGSFMTKIVSFVRQSGGILNSIFSSLGGSITGSFAIISNNITGVANAADDSSQYETCNIPDIKDNNIAAGPFCNIMYGVPTEYLNKDPIQVLKDLQNDGQVDENGDVKDGSELATWKENCTDGSTSELDSCKIDSEKKANYALYLIDTRLETYMDEDTTTQANSTSTSADNEQPDKTKSYNKGWTLKDGVDYSNIACADGTTDNGVYTHPTHKYKIRLCGVKGLPMSSDNNKGVASIISQRVEDLVQAAEKAGFSPKALCAFRSYEAQLEIWNNETPSRRGTYVAEPGSSQHERGLAIDFDTGMSNWSGFKKWLEKHAAEYSLINYDAEEWHWSTSGN